MLARRRRLEILLVYLSLSIALAIVFTSCNNIGAVKSFPDRAVEIDSNAININNADAAELQRIPFVGEKLAEAIIEHRERYGPFRRPEHLLLIKGMSDKRFREIRHLIRVD